MPADDFTDVGELFGEATADDGVTNSSYIPADIALTATTASAAAAAALPAQPKRGLKKRAERKGSVYDGFGDNDAPAEDGTISGWLAAPAVSKDGAEAALDRVGAGVGSFCFRSGSTGLVLCVVTGDGQIGHFRLQQVGDLFLPNLANTPLPYGDLAGPNAHFLARRRLTPVPAFFFLCRVGRGWGRQLAGYPIKRGEAVSVDRRARCLPARGSARRRVLPHPVHPARPMMQPHAAR